MNRLVFIPAIVVALPAAAQVEFPVGAASSAIATTRVRAADDLAVVRDASAQPGARAEAARRLLAAGDQEARQSILQLLASGPQVAEPQGVMISAICGSPTAPAWLDAPLATLLEDSADSVRPKIISALGSVRTRASVRTLIACAGPKQSVECREAAVAALCRLTGRTEYGSDMAKWSEWFAGAEFLTEPDWQRMLAEGLAQSADRATRDRDLALTRLVDVNVQRYQNLPQGEARWTFLAGLMRDEFGQVRRQGVTLVRKELANARTPGPAVVAAAIDLMKDPWPDLRGAGADLVDSIAPSSAGIENAILQALLHETDEGAAVSLLHAARRYPSAGLKPVVLQWMASPGPAGRAAVEAAAALQDHALITGEDERATLREILRRTDPGALPAAGLRLLAEVGSGPDRDAIAGLLLSSNPATRTAAADALAASPESVDMLIAAARKDETYFPQAARAIATHRRTLEGYLQALGLACSDVDLRRETLAAIGGGLDPRTLLSAARATDDLVLRERLLSRLETIPIRRPMLASWGSGAGGGPGTPEPALVAGLLMLAQTRLDLRQPAGALTCLETLTPIAEGVDPVLRASMYTVALLWLDRVDDAAAYSAPAAAWLDGLERAISLPHAREIAGAIHARFGDSLSTADSERLRSLEGRIAVRADGGGASPGAGVERPGG